MGENLKHSPFGKSDYLIITSQIVFILAFEFSFQNYEYILLCLSFHVYSILTIFWLIFLKFLSHDLDGNKVIAYKFFGKKNYNKFDINIK